ncbi:transcription factor Sp4 [Scaptodrosophila lebanonensis]|uniref:Transcription factor Sp4 n=1 Tax=Drosophila lebanonensis TaxID=7225 RepID=A0A6J2U0N0_DROLE|nr:transcription factor Sp4 [Scaptodrosophila lebanonensis]
MEFFATGAFQQLYSDLEEPASATGDVSDFYIECAGSAPLNTTLGIDDYQLAQDCCYADVNFRGDSDPIPYSEQDGDLDYYGIITLDSNNNSNEHFSNLSEEQLQFSLSVDATSGQEFSDWEQRLLDNFVEIPELIDFLPERTPLCTDMCDDFLQESNDNLRLATLSTTSASASASTSTSTPAISPTDAAAEEAAAAAAATQHRIYRQQMHLPLLGQNAAGERGYLCTFGSCEKLYAKPAHLKAHLRRHLGEKPYACSWPDCSWRFSRSDELARHRRSHSGVKPYKCDYCAKCFARSDHLTKHRKVHERRLLAASRAGKILPDGQLPHSVYAVRPGRKRKNQL